jgi:hypothetical protein
MTRIHWGRSFALAVWLLAATTLVHAAPVFRYSLPASWPGPPAAVVDDLSAAGNDANTAGAPLLSSTIPPGADPATRSLDSHGGGFQTQATGLLNNAAVAAAGGFVFDLSFLWDGTLGGFPVQKIIDYAGTESLQLAEIDNTLGTANLRFQFDDDPLNGVVLPILANTWYDVRAEFNTLGNAVAGDGSISGLATLTANGIGTSGPATKTVQGDNLNRRIGVGIFSVAGGIIELEGFIHDPSVRLVPEPSSWILLIVGGLMLGRFAPRRSNRR